MAVALARVAGAVAPAEFLHDPDEAVIAELSGVQACQLAGR